MRLKELYQMSESELLQKYDADRNGLTDLEAKQKLEKFGENILQEGKKKTPFHVFAEQFQDLLVVILIIAAVISMISGNVESTIVIFVVIAIIINQVTEEE